MAEIIWTQIALDDLQSIYDYIAKDSIFYAGRFTDQLIERTDILMTNIEAGRIVPEFENSKLRELIEGSYRIIYYVMSDDRVGIVRIHHSARLLSNLFV